MVNSAMPRNTTIAARFRSSLLPNNANRSRPSPIIMPTVGKWFKSRCTCGKVKFIGSLGATRRRIPLGGVGFLLEMGAGDEGTVQVLRVLDNGRNNQVGNAVGFVGAVVVFG